MANYFQLNIVTAERELFSGLAEKLFVVGSQGELEILFNHAPLLTSVAPGPTWIRTPEKKDEGIVIFGGILEVQPKITTILADSALRAEELDEEAAIKIKKEAERVILGGTQKRTLDYLKIRNEFAVASAQLKFIKMLRNKKR